MAELPTTLSVVSKRPDIEDYTSNLAVHMANALAQVKRYLLNNRGIKWSTVYDSGTADDYFADTDDLENNKDQIGEAITLLTIALVFEAYSIKAQDDSQWWNLYQAFRADSESLMDTMKLDIDVDESGGVTEDEEKETGQRFFSR